MKKALEDTRRTFEGFLKDLQGLSKFVENTLKTNLKELKRAQGKSKSFKGLVEEFKTPLIRL